MCIWTKSEDRTFQVTGIHIRSCPVVPDDYNLERTTKVNPDEWGFAWPQNISKNCYSFCICNHTVFLIQFGINLHEWAFQKAEIAWAASGSAISAFWKTLKCKLISNWIRKPVWLLINNSAGRCFLKPFFRIQEDFFRGFVQNFFHCFTWDHWPTKFLIVFLQIILQNYDV